MTIYNNIIANNGEHIRLFKAEYKFLCLYKAVYKGRKEKSYRKINLATSHHIVQECVLCLYLQANKSGAWWQTVYKSIVKINKN